jgi:type IV pilus assembly protein PilN
VKPIHLNLAARPYRDYRPVYAVVVVMSLLTAFLMLNNVETYYRYTRETRTTRTEIASVENQAVQERQKREAAQQRLAGLDLRLLDQQTKFVNSKLAERAFSWSTLLDELESVLPDDVRLTSVGPSFDEDGTIRLSMQFKSKSSDGMITTINRMNADPQFRDPFPNTESSNDQGFTFNLNAQYIPLELKSAPKSATVARTSALVEARR